MSIEYHTAVEKWTWKYSYLPLLRPRDDEEIFTLRQSPRQRRLPSSGPMDLPDLPDLTREGQYPGEVLRRELGRGTPEIVRLDRRRI